MPFTTAAVRIINGEQVRQKLRKAAPHIVQHNQKMAGDMMEFVRSETQANTPLGPAHFGFHGRDTLRVQIVQKGTKTRAFLRAAAQLGWREFGTRRGERAFQTAHKALRLTKRFISHYYGGMASWWRL